MFPENIMLLDVLIAGVVFAFALSGLVKGLSGEIAHVITLIALGLTLFFVYPHIYRHLYHTFDQANPQLLKWLLLIALALLSFFSLGLISRMLTGILKSQFSVGTDKFWGFMFGFVRGGFLMLIVLIFVGILGPTRLRNILAGRSRIGGFICNEVVPVVQPYAMERLNSLDGVSEKVEKIREIIRPEKRSRLDD